MDSTSGNNAETETRKRSRKDPIDLATDANRKRLARQFNTPAAENAREYDRNRKWKQGVAHRKLRDSFTTRHEVPIPYPPDGTAEYQVDLLRGAERIVLTCWREDCDRTVDDKDVKEGQIMYCRDNHAQPKDKHRLTHKPAVPLTLTTTTKTTFLAAITDREIAAGLYGKDVLDPGLSDYERKLQLSTFKGPIKRKVGTRHVDANTFVTYIGTSDPPGQQPHQPQQPDGGGKTSSRRPDRHGSSSSSSTTTTTTPAGPLRRDQADQQLQQPQQMEQLDPPDRQLQKPRQPQPQQVEQLDQPDQPDQLDQQLQQPHQQLQQLQQAEQPDQQDQHLIP